MEEKAEEHGTYSMGVDTGSELHIVILRVERGGEDGDEPTGRQHLVYLATCYDFTDLDELMKRFRISKCVIDGLPDASDARLRAAAPGEGVHELLQRAPARADEVG